MESIDSAVTRLVGYQPTRKTQIVIDDPYAIGNGSAWPFLDRPIINFWATPPDPREEVGNYRTWGEILGTHEFAHIAHLTRPSRNAFTRHLWQALPVDIGPIAIKAPRWVVEGYATYVEGRVTGSGRPNAAWRPAFLRQWAIEGQLPTYQQLSNWGSYAGGSFAYLAGSAYLEWLVQRQGDSSLVHLWRRMSARRNRGFDEAFTGVFGESPQTLYGRFAAELTAKAMVAARELAIAGLDTGSIVQRLSWDTGDPAISPDGQRVALVIRSAARPARLIIWQTAFEPDTMRARRDSALIKADPEDVPAKSIYPPPKKALATLRAVGGLAYQGPRFLSDGRVLVWRFTARGDGTLTPDVYIWRPDRGRVARVTRGAGLRDPDPAPDARSAIGVRCHGGRCDLAQVNLSDGRVRTIVAGDPRQSYYRPRFAPDGRRVVVAVQSNNRWRLQIVNVDATAARYVDPDDGANRYDASFLTATTLVAVSERGGIANLEEIDLQSGRVRQLTRVTGAAVAPAPNPADSSIWFLSLYSKGYDVRRLDRPHPVEPVITLGGALAPAAPVAARDSVLFGRGPVSTPRPYGLGPRLFRWIPAPQAGTDGAGGVLALASSDVIGRNELLAQIAVGDGASWRGAALSATWRGTRAPHRLLFFDATQRPSESRSGVPIAANLDARLAGGALIVDHADVRETHAIRTRVGLSLARLSPLVGHTDAAPPDTFRASARALFVFDGSSAWQYRAESWRLSAFLTADATHGRSGGAPLTRRIASFGFSLGGDFLARVNASAQVGAMNASASAFEQFALGGFASPLIDRTLLTQRIVMPALPTGIAVGRSLFVYRVALPVGALTPYVWAASTTRVDGDYKNWHRVVGAEWTASLPQIALAGVPAARAQVGFSRSLDEPFAKKSRAYASLVFNP